MENNFRLALKKSKWRDVELFPKTLRLLVYLQRLFVWGGRMQWYTPAIEASTAHFFFALTPNQVDAVTPVADQVNYEVAGSGRLFTIEDMVWVQFVSRICSLPFLPLLVIRYLGERGYRKCSFNYAIDEYWQAYGLYLILRIWLRRLPQLKTVTVSNDHNLLPCAIVAAAKAEGISTFYIQHACVTDRFPPLRVANALLDGRDANEKYESHGDSPVSRFLVGMPKFDNYNQAINRSDCAKAIGICFSVADSPQKCTELIEGLLELNSLSFVVRPHMGMPHGFIERLRQFCKEKSIGFSEHGVVHAFDFLSSIDVLISGTSSIALEAALLNITPLNYVLCAENPDWYGFVARGLVRSTDSLQELRCWVSELQKSRPPVRELAKFYCSSVGTRADGKSSRVAADLILSNGSSRAYVHEVEKHVFSL
jgi:hypothetical protein